MSEHNPTSPAGNGRPGTEITFTIDGQVYTVSDKHQTAAALLTLAGLAPAGYDLAEIRGPGKTHTYEDDHPIIVKAGDAFVTVRESAQVA